MGKKVKKSKLQEYQPLGFLDQIAPVAVKFNTDHFILGSAYHSTLALRGYPTGTEELALLSRLGEHSGVTLHIYARLVTAAEEEKIIHNATNKNRLDRSNTNDMKQTVTAEVNLQDVANLIASMHRNQEPLLHCAVFVELTARDSEGLRTLRDEVMSELVRSKLSADRLYLRQQDGFLSSNPAGRNTFGSKYERVLPASSVANLFPFNYSGKTDPQGFYIGKDKYGSNVIVDLMSGQYRINPLEPKVWDVDGDDEDDGPDTPAAFRERSRLSQHISFLKDFFHSYKDFTDRHVDTIEIMLERLYEKWGFTDQTNFAAMRPADFPILSDLYAVIEDAYQNYDKEQNPLYPAELLQEVLLGLHSMCKGAESKFFNGCTNITSSRFLVFGVKGVLQASGSVKNALLFNVLSYLSDKLLTVGNTVAVLDELYLFLSNPTTIEYIRNFMKRVRKKDSALLLASQNLEDFTMPGVAELTKPLFSIPTHQFLFNAGSIDRRFFMDNLQLEESEYEHIRFPLKGLCLYKCGNERYLLEVHAPDYKRKLFGEAGGR